MWARIGAKFSILGPVNPPPFLKNSHTHMTAPFLPRPSPEHHVAFERDSNDHLRGKHVRVLWDDADEGAVEGHGYIFGHGARKKGEDAGVCLSNQDSNPRAAKPTSKPPSLVSCFISFTNASHTIRALSPFLYEILFFAFMTLSHSPSFKQCFHFQRLPSLSLSSTRLSFHQ